jgi:hypothetical protein
MYSKYLGPTQHRRILTVADQKSLGVKDAVEDLVWDRSNKWTLSLNGQPDEIKKFLQDDPMFEVETGSAGDTTVEDTPVVLQGATSGNPELPEE